MSIVNRLNTNSFQLKGWSVTIVAGLLAFASKDQDRKFILISVMVVIVCWVLDGFFITVERRYKSYYELVCNKAENEINFSMILPEELKKQHPLVQGVFSKTLIPIYGVLLLSTVLSLYFLA